MAFGVLYSYMHKMKLNHLLTPYTKINSRWIVDLNISHDTIKALEENIGRKISDIPHSNIFTDMSPRVGDIKERIKKWDFIKIKRFYMTKENISKMKRGPTVWRYLPVISWTEVCSLKYIKNSHDPIPGRETTQLKKWVKDLNTHFSKEYIHKTQRHKKMLSITSHQRDAN